MKVKKRLDHLLAERYPTFSRQQLQSFIMQGLVRVDGIVTTKPGTQVVDSALVTLHAEQPKYVSRAGFKLEHALDTYNIDVAGTVALDAGISTGGFTDCLLQYGADKVYGIDVGYGQVHEKIRSDPRVIIKERTNIRHLEDVGELVDLVTLDLSFISVLKVMPAITKLLKPNGELIVLVKPQFEAERHEIGKGGIVRDETIRNEIVKRVTSGIAEQSFTLIGVTPSPVRGATGNQEYLAYFKRA